MKFMGPIILVENLDLSRDFYERILKQKVTHDFGVNVSFENGLAIHSRTHFEEIHKMKGSHPILYGSNSAELNFETEELDDIYNELKQVKVEFIHEIQEAPWGQRGITFYDPDKHVVSIGEAMEGVVNRLYKQGLSVDEVVSKTAMPKEFVEQAIKKTQKW
ncbi:VOC family protein [Gorillibacterium timonense]|uniref:VOC family protein n=1 Tax=Gorillibacterium timonense TaxID=1689269 RepID=UPI00071DDA58|nr:VOC family protein [Gorillibacterium timonense]